LSFTLAQTLSCPDQWKIGLKLMDEANRDGVNIKAQVLGRPTGMLVGLDLSFNPFTMYPTFMKIAHLPLAEKIAFLRNPDNAAKLINEEPLEPKYPGLKFMQKFDWVFPLGDPPNYEPAKETSVGYVARARGVKPQQVCLEYLLADEGRAVLFVTAANYCDGTLNAMLEMMKNKNTLIGLGDGGAHYGMVCDAGNPTFMMTHWTRDRVGEKFSLPHVVKHLTSAPAQAVQLFDRGLIAPGYKGDLNVINYDKLRLHAPAIKADLPAGGRRISQGADGYIATAVNGVVTYEDGQWTGERPGRLIRGAQAAPTPYRAAAE